MWGNSYVKNCEGLLFVFLILIIGDLVLDRYEWFVFVLCGGGGFGFGVLGMWV